MAKSEILPLPAPVIEHHGNTIFTAMTEWRAQRRVPPALLITGIPGVGKRSIATLIAQWLLCEHRERTPTAEPLPCGDCASCRRALANSWVDFLEILPEEEEGTLKIDQFRKVKASLGFGAHEGEYRVVLIPNADRMTTQAANSILKLLEEPPPGWLFFLTASDPTLILPTVLSRCQRLRLKPFPAQTLQQLLAHAGVDQTRQAVCAELSQGSWGKALQLAEEETWKQRKLLFDFLSAPGKHLNELVDWATQAPSHFDLLIDHFESVTADLIRWSISSSSAASPESYPWTNSDGARALMDYARQSLRAPAGFEAARAFWLTQSERIARARQESLAPVNRKILVQDVLMPWLNQ